MISACVIYVHGESQGAQRFVKGASLFHWWVRNLRNSLIRLIGAANPIRPRRGESPDEAAFVKFLRSALYYLLFILYSLLFQNIDFLESTFAPEENYVNQAVIRICRKQDRLRI